MRSEAGGEILRGLAGVLLGRAKAFPAREGFFDLRAHFGLGCRIVNCTDERGVILVFNNRRVAFAPIMIN